MSSFKNDKEGPNTLKPLCVTDPPQGKDRVAASSVGEAMGRRREAGGSERDRDEARRAGVMEARRAGEASRQAAEQASEKASSGAGEREQATRQASTAEQTSL